MKLRLLYTTHAEMSSLLIVFLCFQKLSELFCRHRLIEIVALNIRTFQRAQEIHLIALLHALRRRIQTQLIAQADNLAENRFALSIPDAVNQALSAGHACLYGLAHAVIVALGCAPGLGFVHVGHECSFVYDIADLYKAEVTIPIAFEVAAQAPEDLPSVVRRRVRDAMVEHHILERMVHDIRYLLLNADEPEAKQETVYLWDNKIGTVANGINYFEEEEGEETS